MSVLRTVPIAQKSFLGTTNSAERALTVLAYVLYAQSNHATVRLFGAAHAQSVETHAIEHAAHNYLANTKSRAGLLTSQ